MIPRSVSLCWLSLGVTLLWADVSPGQDLRDVFEIPVAPWLTQTDTAETEGEVEHLETDRDSFTPATSTVGTGRVLFESAYSFIANRGADNTHSFPEIVTRIGLTERTELRLGWNYEIGGGGSVSGGDAGGGLDELESCEESQVLYGFKAELTEQSDWIPASAGFIQGTTPTSGSESASDLQLGYVCGRKFFDDWQLDSSIRYITTKEEGDHFNQWAPSIVLKVPVGRSWNLHAEYFGIFTAGRAESSAPQYFSPGIHYLISPDFEVGVRVGWGLNEDAANSFTNVGFGLRF